MEWAPEFFKRFGKSESDVQRLLNDLGYVNSEKLNDSDRYFWKTL